MLISIMVLSALVVPLIGTAGAATPDNSYFIDVTPDTATAPNGTDVTYTVTRVDLVGAPEACADAAGCEVDFEIETGGSVTVKQDNTAVLVTPATHRVSNDGNTPLTPDATCTIPNAADDCDIIVSGAAQGTNLIRAWVDNDADNATTDADTTEGLYAGPTDDGVPGAPAPGSRTELDDTDVFSATWQQGFATACIDAEPETSTNPSGTNHSITARATNANAYTPSDQPEAYNCGGTALAGATVTVTITDDTPDAYIVSVNGTPTGGPAAGGPNTVDATTDSNGQVVVVISCVSAAPANCNGGNTVSFTIPGVTAGPDTDSVNKVWAPAGTPAAIDASPEVDTNEVGQTHSMACEIADAFGTGVAGQNCDFNITAGPNSTVNVDGNALTPVGYVGQCTTGANGSCSVSYTSAATGTDTVHVFHDVNNNDVDDGEIDDDITKSWVAAGAGVTKVRIDMVNCNGDLVAPIDETTWEAAASDAVGDVEHLCAQAFSSADAPLTAPVTFSITSGPGHFTDVSGTENFGASVTVDDTGYAEIYITSSTVGDTLVTATSHGASDTGTQTWTAGVARNIEVTTPPEAQPGTSAQASALVTDRNDNPVAGVTVSFTETGPAVITSTNPVVTDASGVAEIIYTSTTEGTSTVTASISAGATDCELPAGNPAGAPAGNCTDSAETEWSEDAGPGSHSRSASLKKPRHVKSGKKRKLKVAGTLSTDDGFTDCSTGQTVKIQFKKGGGWRTKKSDTTNGNGQFKVLIRDAAKKYRAVAPASTAGSEICGKTTSNVRKHRHGGGGAKFYR